MKLYYSATSPYVRKVMVVALETGLDSRIEQIPTDAWADGSDIVRGNPLGKVPALITDGGEHLYDSPVICEYLDSLHDGARLFPASGGARWTALRRQALGDGIMDAALLLRVETARRPEEVRWESWIVRQKAALTRSLDLLEEEASDLAAPFTIGSLTIACALGFLDFRFDDFGWRKGRPALAGVYETLAVRPSLQATRPVG
ncbi:MAG: glutathione S-transferase N-terminal domain-containing protein [Rhodospirillaceae bacterium]|nr:glutathione S-transferase N-terminal domain-containing protein [Rhodospirillaceae bacterium]